MTDVRGAVSSRWIDLTLAPDEREIDIGLAEALNESSADGIKDRDFSSLPELAEAVDIVAVLLRSGKMFAELMKNGNDDDRNSDSLSTDSVDNPVNSTAALDLT